MRKANIDVMNQIYQLKNTLNRYDRLSTVKLELLKSDSNSLERKTYEFYLQKLAYKTKISDVTIKCELVKESQAHNIFPFEMLIKIKEMMQIFKTDKNSFYELIRLAVETWDENHLDYIADFIVNFMFNQPDKANSDAFLLNRLQTIIDIDIEFLGSLDNVEMLLEHSLTMKIFYHILELPETIAYVRFIMKNIYDQINIGFLDSIAFDEFICRAFINKQNDPNNLLYINKESRSVSNKAEVFNIEEDTFIENGENYSLINGVLIPLCPATPIKIKTRKRK